MFGTHQHVISSDARARLPSFLRAGDEEAQGSPVLVHTPATVARLRTLAAAASSGRTVCLQGDTAAGKTALVQELARLAGRRLHVLPLTADSGESRGLCRGPARNRHSTERQEHRCNRNLVLLLLGPQTLRTSSALGCPTTPCTTATIAQAQRQSA